MLCEAIELSEEQARIVEEVERAISNWRRDDIISIGGYAGTGKSVVVSHLAEKWKGAAVCALSGKAAHVLRQKGVDRAQTIHSLIYQPYEDDEGKTKFRRRKKLVLPNGGMVRRILVDEASMVDHITNQDLLSYGLPIVYVGDHGQLQPIGADPGIMASPKYRLETVHRQAMGSPIIRAATAWREGRHVPYWDAPDGSLQVVPKRDFAKYKLDSSFTIICGFNASRHALNREIRRHIGFTSNLPCTGDKVMCLRNNRTAGIFNGQIGEVMRAYPGKRETDLEVVMDDGRDAYLTCLNAQFGVDLIKDHKDTEVVQLDWGYALTAHRAQGSEFEKVLVLEEISSSWDKRRWRYTCATRARRHLVHCY
jgi:exodeoxyribonuclease-5